MSRGSFKPLRAPGVCPYGFTVRSRMVGGEPAAREFRQNNVFLRSLPILGLLDPRTATDTAARARSFRVPPSAWICVDPSRSKMAGIAVQRPAGARRKRLAQNHHSGGQPVRAAGHWRGHGGQPDHRDGLCRPCRPSTTRPGQPSTAGLAPQGKMATIRPLPDLSTL